MTIKEIAKEANVSIGTVDRVVHGRGRVSPKTTEVVKKIIRESGYRPNIFGSRLSLSKDFTFAVLMPRFHQDSRYWEISAKGISQAQEELRDYKVKIKYFLYDRYSDESVKRETEKILRTEVDGILIAPVLHRPIKRFLQEITDRIPYVLFNANIPDSNAVSYIGQDSFQSGVLAAKLMRMMLSDKGSLAVIIAAPDDYHILERADGFHSFFEDIKGYTIETYKLRPCTKDSFDDLMKEIVVKQKELNGIFVANASTHFAAEYLKSRVTGRKICLIGYDLIEENVKYLEDGIIDFIINQKAETQGYKGIYVLYRKVVLKESVERHIMVPLDIITKENLIYYQSN
jgi:LacI family transcriptional regulator